MSRFYYDQRGHGRSDYGTPEFWNLRTWADDLRRLYDTLGLVKPVLASTTGGRSDHQRSAEVFRRLGGDEAAVIAERDFADPTEESLADYRRVCHPLYSSEPGDAETLRQRRARSIQTTEVNRHYSRNEASRFDPWGVADMIKCPVLILAGEDDPVCPLPIAEASASWGWPGRVGDLLSGRSCVRVAVGTQIMQLDTDIRNYECSDGVLLAGNHSI